MKNKASGPLGDVLKKLVSKIGKEGRQSEEEILRAWRGAAGKKAAGHTRPVALKRSVLAVNVDNSGWLYELTINKKKLLKKLETKFKGKKLKDIRFRIGEVAK